jgi:hypothetical protein
VGRQVHDEIRAIVQKRAGSDLTWHELWFQLAEI